ncbi:hypothetical protein M408DRAFT_220824 [Serendipita vermifera MAFF 305830]|uniref:Uncharacterized protein n=1 Tax=Serendipita vermifera MAFF 305830 TaxID=933852 RepID=A0A0C2WQH9_SERVB|nr:hypothetical protein M408DRAFT_170344 [Serendipita vermifera MAFF 305830]KIM25171.1 hypothetical protein M408DRAFT_220824 [Serendipita vermifera MAFF 305830]
MIGATRSPSEFFWESCLGVSPLIHVDKDGLKNERLILWRRSNVHLNLLHRGLLQ